MLNWNGLAMTEACVQSLLAQTTAARAIVVVDNGSANGEAAALRHRFGAAIEVLALPANLGFAGGCNAAFDALLARPECEFIALLNNDTAPHVDWLREMIACAEAHPRAGLELGSRGL